MSTPVWSAKVDPTDTVNIEYHQGDEIIFGTGDQRFVCLLTHIASDSFVSDFLSGKWRKVISTVFRYVRPWSVKSDPLDVNNALYDVGDTRAYANTTYTCTIKHEAGTSFNHDFLLGYWTKNLTKASKWVPKTPYCRGDLITYGHLRFVCRLGHISSIKFRTDLSTEVDLTKILSQDYELRSFYVPPVLNDIPQPYLVGSNISYHGRFFRCIKEHILSANPGQTGPYYLGTTEEQEASAPGVGSNWEEYWELIPHTLSGTCPRWGGYQFWYEKDVVKLKGNYYVCIQNYEASGIMDMDYYEPGIGSSYRTYWEKLSIWELIQTKNVFAPGWMQDIPWIADYLQAVEETAVNLVDYPLVSLTKIRDVGIESDDDVLSKTIAMLGYPLPSFNNKLLKLGAFHLYAASISQYNEDSGTNYFIKFLNFITSKPTEIVGGLDQYVRCDPDNIGDRSHPEKSNWTTIPLYTRDYQTFWTREELLIMLGFKPNYVYKGSWGVSLAIDATDTVLHNGWLWTANVASVNSEPTITNADWILTAFIPVEYVDCFDNMLEQPDGSASNPWDLESPLYLRNAADYSSAVLTTQLRHGYYLSSRVYLYRSDRADYLGQNLETNPDWSGISDLYYSFAPANSVIYTKTLGYDYTFGVLQMVTISQEHSETEEAQYIPFICTDQNGDSTVKYPRPVTVENWVFPEIGSNPLLPQNNFSPTLNGQ